MNHGDRSKKSRVGTFLLGLGTYLYARMIGWDGVVLREVIPALPAVLLGLAAVLGAQLAGSRRFMAYAAVLIAAGVVTIIFHLGPAAPMLMGGAVITIFGTVLVGRFLRASARFEEGD